MLFKTSAENNGDVRVMVQRSSIKGPLLVLVTIDISRIRWDFSLNQEKIFRTVWKILAKKRSQHN